MRHIAVFGAQGDIGKAVVATCSRHSAISRFDQKFNSNTWGEYFCDVRDFSSCHNALRKSTEDKGPANDLVYSVGRYEGLTFETLTGQAMSRIWEVNCLGFINVLLSWLEYSNDTSNRKIVVISSAAARLPGQDVAYASSKAALDACIRTLARPLAEKQVLIYGVSPGVVNSKMAQVVSKERFVRHASANAFSKAATPADIACITEALLMKPLKYLTGSILDASGAV